MRKLIAFFCLLLWAAPAWAVNDAAILAAKPPKLLSEYGLFTDLKALTPADGVLPYDLGTPLFTDYAEKHRMVYIPAGKSAKANGTDTLEFPIGTALVKSFGYQALDGAGYQVIETRLLLHKEDGWVALPYVWNADKSDAKLKVAGKRLNVTFIAPSGAEKTISYLVPNKNQCKSCHSLKGEIRPIGPKPRNLNKDFSYADGPATQLETWVAHGALAELPNVPPAIDAFDTGSASLNDRARAYLDTNCGHCHRAGGFGDNSGLFLLETETTPMHLGINKRPVAAGRGSGGLEFDIAPGDPESSILLYRMTSVEPDIAMPELGRALVHDEAVALIKEWIESLE